MIKVVRKDGEILTFPTDAWVSEEHGSFTVYLEGQQLARLAADNVAEWWKTSDEATSEASNERRTDYKEFRAQFKEPA